MKILNSTRLPGHIASVLEAAWRNDAYDAPTGLKTISVTKLIGPAQKLVLEREYEERLEMDVLDTVPSLLGQALHHILERAGSAAPHLIPEERLSVMHDGWTISGKSDIFETQDRTLIDYKNSSVWTYIFGKIEWEQQLNVLRWIRERNGQPVHGLAVVLFCGDWRRSEARRNPDYPARVVNIPVKMWSLDETTAYVDSRLALHRATADGSVPPCSPEERWAKPTSYAVMKPGRKTALKVCADYDEALAAAGAAGSATVIKRPGESVRCNGYCTAAPFCPQWSLDETNPANAKEAPE